jgi:hypothetical protein
MINSAVNIWFRLTRLASDHSVSGDKRMRVQHIFLLAFVLVVLSLTPQLALTQSEGLSCEPLVEQGFSELQENCSGLEVDSACFGFNAVTATLLDAAGNGNFSQPGDRVGLPELQTLQTAALDPSSEQWGIALMNIQANVPTSLDGQGVTFLLLGDVTVENAVAPDQVLQVSDPITVTTLVGANLRSAPSTDAQVISSVPAGTELAADGLNRDSTWLRVFHEGQVSWVSRSVLAINDPVDVLPIWGTDDRTLMQNFYFTTGNGLADCTGALPALLVIQGPEDISVSLTVNGADIRLDSTMVMWISADNEMRVMVLSGSAQVGALSVPAGFTVEAELSEDGHSIAGEWTSLRAMTQGEREVLAMLESLPEDLLSNPIEIPTEGQIQETLAALGASSIGEASTGPAAGRADCRLFRPTSPLGGFAFGTTDFYWDAAQGADNYRVNIYGEGGALVGSFLTNSANTALSIDTSAGNIGGGFNFSWEVEALVNNQTACTSSRVTVLREGGSQSVSSGGGGGDDDGGGGGDPWGN